VVFGATGDLTKRKLVPALYHRFKDGQFDEQSRIIGASRSKLSPG
jgi:glucose-6-phosphate 1-dehydrogenase